jgi:hypothetical protein
MTYAEKLKDPRWLKKRIVVLQRDAFTCRDCRATDKPLQVHHCRYSRGEPWEVDDEFLLTLCEACHVHRQQSEREIKKIVETAFCNSSVAALNRVLEVFKFSNAGGGGGGRLVISVVNDAGETIRTSNPQQKEGAHGR